MRKTRGSIIFLGAVLSRTGRVRLSLPGGCDIGLRPIDLHLSALRKLGAEIRERHGCLDCRAPFGLKGCKISLAFPSVGATEHIIIAACLARGTTTITNAAREPEIADLAEFLNSCGAKIYGAGEGVVVIDGVGSAWGCAHSVIPDRIVAATFMSAAAATGSGILIKDAIPAHLGAVIPLFEEMGCIINTKNTNIKISAPERLRPLKTVRTMPYPGFPTDAQAPLMAAACVADGTSVFTENIFENRFRHTRELARMGAQIKTEGRVCVVEGREKLYGARVNATDLRGAAALVTAALCAEGKTRIGSLHYLERGYESLELSLSSLGADIKRI
jgi:UDP-N-acetylglucosamine 1-carboxyvinyltransferase